MVGSGFSWHKMSRRRVSFDDLQRLAQTRGFDLFNLWNTFGLFESLYWTCRHFDFVLGVRSQLCQNRLSLKCSTHDCAPKGAGSVLILIILRRLAAVSRFLISVAPGQVHSASKSRLDMRIKFARAGALISYGISRAHKRDLSVGNGHFCNTAVFVVL